MRAYPELVAGHDDERRRRRRPEMDPLAVAGLHLQPLHLVLADDGEHAAVLVGPVPDLLPLDVTAGRVVLRYPEHVPHRLPHRVVVPGHPEPLHHHPLHRLLQLRDPPRRAMDGLAACRSKRYGVKGTI
jgi:hypothetical protein